MAFIRIKSFPNGQVAGASYTFKEWGGTIHEKRKIRPGEVAEVANEDLDFHLNGGIVEECRGPATFDQGGPAKLARKHKRVGRGKNNRPKPIPAVKMKDVPDAVRELTGLGSDQR